MTATDRTLLIAHPSPDVYGSDLQLLETVEGARKDGWRVVVELPADGPLVALLRARGATVEIDDFPVLRKALLTPRNLLRLLLRSPATVLASRRTIRRWDADVVYVNTVTIPFWLVAARAARRPALCHVHEAEEGQARVVALALAAPLTLAGAVVANSQAARRVLLTTASWLRAKVTVVYNGVPGPDGEPQPALAGRPARIALVGRLSPRKGIDVALEAVGVLVARGYDVALDVCGSAFAGYEWYEEELRTRIAHPDLAARVVLHGYTARVWPVLATSTVVIVPSRHEPFGNTAVEGLLAGRPVVASDVQGLAEIIRPGENGLLVPADDPAALASAIASLLDDPEFARRLARAGRDDAVRRFSPERYRTEVVEVIDSMSRRSGRGAAAGTTA